jgi:hypothetical protein
MFGVKNQRVFLKGSRGFVRCEMRNESKKICKLLKAVDVVRLFTQQHAALGAHMSGSLRHF